MSKHLCKILEEIKVSVSMKFWGRNGTELVKTERKRREKEGKRVRDKTKRHLAVLVAESRHFCAWLGS